MEKAKSGRHTESLTKSKERVSKLGEVFTPSWLVKDMCDMLPPDAWNDVSKTFLEPSCGTGNFLVEILRRKLDICNGIDEFFTALGSIYGVDMMPDNIEEAKDRMLDIFVNYCGRRQEAKAILDRNIVCGDFLTKKTVEGNPIWFLEDEENEQLTLGGF